MSRLSFALAAILASCLVSLPAQAQIISSAADNDMDPNFGADGWANVVGSYDVVLEPGGFIGHAWLEPPDGNTYGGGVQYSGVPGTAEAIQKSIAGLTPGVAYAIEWYIMADRVQGSSTEEAWFDVSFCSSTLETLHIPFDRSREWIREVQVFTADATSCNLRFTARNPSGNNSNWIFLDSVQVAVATSTDFAIAATGPSLVSPGTSGTVSITIHHRGPDEGTAPVVTYPLPDGASVNGGAAGAVTAAGADGGSWMCSSDDGVPQTIVCTRTGPMTTDMMSSFDLDLDFDPAPGATLVSALTVEPTFQAGNADPDPTNDVAMFSSRATECGDGAIEGGEVCDDGNTTADDGCGATCTLDPGFTCPTADTACVPICGDSLVVLGEGCDDGNATPDDGCTSCVVDDGWRCTGAPSVCGAAACGDGIVAGDEACDDENDVTGDGCDACSTEVDWTCGGSPSVCVRGVCGDGLLASVEACDDGGTDDGDGCSMTCTVEPGWDCTGVPSVCGPAECGDGLPRGDEACDDGNGASGDGCDEGCAVEDGWRCSGEPSACLMICGNGSLDSGETCDDANDAGGDGCDACLVESGWVCSGEPSVCLMTCGNGRLDPTESCDDENDAPGDGCASCAVEAGWSCEGEPSTCSTTCGDGVVAGLERCDDGNTMAGDGCDAMCDIESVEPCDGGPCPETGRVVGGLSCGVSVSSSPTAAGSLLGALFALLFLRRRRSR